MKIAVVSEKKGAGKTTVSVNLAYSSPEYKLIDMNIRESKCESLIKPNFIYADKRVYFNFPIIDNKKCILCCNCISMCNFNAIDIEKTEIKVFKNNGDKCIECTVICKNNAISYGKRWIGSILKGEGKNSIILEYGKMQKGERYISKVINEIKNNIKKEAFL